MGIVFKAKHCAANRIVALKMILSGSYAREAEFERFQTEVAAAASVMHPGIVTIYDVNQTNGLPYYSLEFCEGGTLKERIDGTPLSPRSAAMIVHQLAIAMQAAHEKNIIHRDLKPANILIASHTSGVQLLLGWVFGDWRARFTS
jgi:serine/threonine-protein kinase